MFGLHVLDIILGLVFVYFVLSIVCSAANEGLSHLLNMRAETLREGIRVLVSGSATGTEPAEDPSAENAAGLMDGLYSHPLILGMSQRKRAIRIWKTVQLPSYIPAPIFATALLDIIAPTGAERPKTVQEIRSAVAALPEQIRRPLLIFMDEAEGDRDRLRANIGRWYEDAMLRVGGLYKRRTQLLIAVIAAIVTLLVHADSIRIVRALSTDAALRQAVVAHAQAVAARPDATGQAGAQPTDAPPGEPQTPGAQASARDVGVAASVQQIRSSIDELQTLGIPLGWPAPDSLQHVRHGGENDRIDRRGEWVGYYVWESLRNFPGLLITVLAVSMGAPFWFDILNKVVNIRAAGRAPEEKPKPPEALPPARGA